MSKYLNSTDRQEWLQLFFVAESLEKLKENDKKYNTETLKYLRSGYTYIKKGIDEMIKDFPQYANTFVNDMEYYRVLFLPKEQAFTEKDRLIAEKCKNPIDALYDTLDISMGELCVGCKGKESCRLRDALEFYDIPVVDEADTKCKWRL